MRAGACIQWQGCSACHCVCRSAFALANCILETEQPFTVADATMTDGSVATHGCMRARWLPCTWLVRCRAPVCLRVYRNALDPSCNRRCACLIHLPHLCIFFFPGGSLFVFSDLINRSHPCARALQTNDPLHPAWHVSVLACSSSEFPVGAPWITLRPPSHAVPLRGQRPRRRLLWPACNQRLAPRSWAGGFACCWGKRECTSAGWLLGWRTARQRVCPI